MYFNDESFIGFSHDGINWQYTTNENISIILSFVDRDKCKATIIKKPNILEKNKMNKSLFDVETKTTDYS